jgi:hypothetical protein
LSDARSRFAKLGEEAQELSLAAPEERLGELADLREVLTSRMEALGYSEAEVDEAATRKRAKRGGFVRRLWLDEGSGLRACRYGRGRSSNLRCTQPRTTILT